MPHITVCHEWVKRRIYARSIHDSVTNSNEQIKTQMHVCLFGNHLFKKRIIFVLKANYFFIFFLVLHITVESWIYHDPLGFIPTLCYGHEETVALRISGFIFSLYSHSRCRKRESHSRCRKREWELLAPTLVMRPKPNQDEHEVEESFGCFLWGHHSDFNKIQM